MFDPPAPSQTEQELLELLYLCPVGIVKLDVYGSILLMNPYGAQMLMPLSPERIVTNLFDLFESFAPEVGEMARRFPARTGSVCDEHRICLPPQHLEDRRGVLSVTLQKVNADVFVAVLTDVTSAAERERFIRESEERLHAVLDGVRDYAICTVDERGRITSWNDTAERLDAYRSDEAIGRHLDFLVPAAGSSGSPMARRLEIALHDETHDFDGWRVRKDGTRYWANTSISVLFGRDRRHRLGFLIITQDLTERRRAEDRLRLLAMTDPLTGALNRRSFFENAKAEHSRHHTACAIILIDVDFFKRVNDRYGHEAGDATLQRIVADCRKEIRSSDLLGRFGGEEFAILLPLGTGATGRAIAERIRSRIAESGRLPGAIPCTVSIGLAFAASADETIEAIIKRADQSLYAAKAAGRNRVVVAGDVPETKRELPA